MPRETILGWRNKCEVAVEMAAQAQAKCDQLELAIRQTIMENLHLADGDVCTLKRLKDAIGFELPEEV